MFLTKRFLLYSATSLYSDWFPMADTYICVNSCTCWGRKVEIIKNQIKPHKKKYFLCCTLYFIHVLYCNSLVYLPHLVCYLLSFIVRHHITLALSTLLSLSFWSLSLVMSSKNFLKRCDIIKLFKVLELINKGKVSLRKVYWHYSILH